MKNEETEKILQDLTEMQIVLNQDGSTYWKQNTLRQYEHLKSIIEIIYNPFKLFHLTGERVVEYRDLDHRTRKLSMFSFPSFLTLEGLLNDLVNQEKLYGIGSCIVFADFIDRYEEHEDIIRMILNKNLKCGISIKTINKVWPGLLPEFNVPLARDYKEGMCDFENEDWYLSRKLDGIRCLAFITDEEITLYSRKGIEFYTLGIVKDILRDQFYEPISLVLDGEISLTNKDEGDNFNSIMQKIRRKNYTISNPRFNLFDTYSIQEFRQGISDNPSLFFREKLDLMLSKFPPHSGIVSTLPQTRIKSYKDIEKAVEELPKGWEGYMLRRDAPTKFTRSKDLLKVKNFYDAEYKVVGTVTGTKTIYGKETLTCGSLIIIHKGYGVNVGSGLSDLQRLKWHNDPRAIVGKIITVQYQNESVNKDGGISLRIPTLKKVWDTVKE